MKAEFVLVDGYPMLFSEDRNVVKIAKEKGLYTYDTRNGGELGRILTIEKNPVTADWDGTLISFEDWIDFRDRDFIDTFEDDWMYPDFRVGEDMEIDDYIRNYRILKFLIWGDD